MIAIETKFLGPTNRREEYAHQLECGTAVDFSKGVAS